MERFSAGRTLLAIDLDDTLYKENDYRLSGLHSVTCLLQELYGKHLDESLFESKLGDTDWLMAICDSVGVPYSVKEQLIWVYRLHHPAIKLDANVTNLLRRFTSIFLKLVILTDGRAVTQRLKLKALGLGNYPAYISEECGIEKPDPVRFTQVMHDCQADLYVYIGDNPQKDFVAPNNLGWKTFGIRGDRLNIHSQDYEELPPEYKPHVWLNCLDEILDYVC